LVRLLIDLPGTLRRLATAVAAISTATERGTDDAALASVLGAIDDAQSKGPTTGAETGISLLRQAVEYVRGTHNHIHILFVIPEAVASINADNTAIQTEIAKLCYVHTITQTDALSFPNFTIYSLCVLGTNKTAWNTANLAHIKTIPQLPILCFDKVAAAYLEIGTDGGDATSKTAIDVTAKVEGAVIGIGGAEATGLAVGANTISSSATYHTLDMSNANITEDVYATVTEDVDGGSANTDVVIGQISGVLESGAIGIDETGDEVPATLTFFGAGYEAAKLNSLGLAVIHNCAHTAIHAQKKPIEIAGTVQNLRSLIIGNMGGQFGNTTPVVEWLAGQNTAGTKLPIGTSLYDKQLDIVTEVNANETKIDNVDGDLVTHNTALTNHEASQSTHRTALTSHESSQSTHRAVLVDIHDTDLPAVKTVVDANAALLAATIAGKPQIVVDSTDWDSLAANTYALVTAVGQDVIVESITLYTTRDLSGDAGFTGVSYQTDATTPMELISQADGVKANLTAEGQIYSGGLAVLLKPGTYIEFTVYGGAVAAVETLVDVVITYKAVVDGGYIA